MLRQTVAVKRPTGNGTWTKGQFTASATTSFNILASIQPLSGNEMQSLPEGRREKEAIRLYTSTELKIAAEGGANADVVTIAGKDYEVIAVYPWRNGILNHFKVIVSRI